MRQPLSGHSASRLGRLRTSFAAGAFYQRLAIWGAGLKAPFSKLLRFVQQLTHIKGVLIQISVEGSGGSVPTAKRRDQLSGAQVKQLRDTLVDAFTCHTLEQLVRIHLGVNLERIIAGPASLQYIVFKVVQWAEQNGRVDELIAGACSENPHNAALREAAQALGTTSFHI